MFNSNAELLTEVQYPPPLQLKQFVINDNAKIMLSYFARARGNILLTRLTLAKPISGSSDNDSQTD